MNATLPKTLYLAWQDYQSRSWFPVGQLTFDGKVYTFVYINGAKQAQQKCGFEPLMSFPEWNRVYCSTELFAFFANRVMPRSRPDYQSFLDRFNLSAQNLDLMEFLGRTEGERQTDNFKIFPCPQRNPNGQYHFSFLAHGLRYLPECSVQRMEQLEVGESLWLAHEFHNPYDNKALTLNTKDHHILGYYPRYLVEDVFEVLRHDPKLVEVKVAKVNLPPSPLKSRLLCEITYSGFEGYVPFAQEQYQPLTEEHEAISFTTHSRNY
jgi:hypothetical protein